MSTFDLLFSKNVMVICVEQPEIQPRRLMKDFNIGELFQHDCLFISSSLMKQNQSFAVKVF